MDTDTRIKLAIYHHFAEFALAPSVADIAASVGLAPDAIRDAYRRLFTSRVLVLDADGESIRMAPPFSGVATQHRVRVAGREYFANCAWDAFGIPAALKQAGTVFSRCEQSGEPLTLEFSLDEPPPSDWLFHCAVPAARWWQDIVYT